MSGVLPNRNIAALRLNSSVVKWYEKAGGVRKDKLPVAGGDKFVGLVMLFSTDTGEPLAIFPDGYVQKLRVAGNPRTRSKLTEGPATPRSFGLSKPTTSTVS